MASKTLRALTDINPTNYNEEALSLFRYQATHVPVYRKYLSLLGKLEEVNRIKILAEIPFLPISLFKEHKVMLEEQEPQCVFYSSGTTGQKRSKHYVSDLSLYQQSHLITFQKYYGNLSDYVILALLPNYLEQGNSSLVHMVNEWIVESGNPESGFYLNNTFALANKLQELEQRKQPTILIGVSYALLDFAAAYPMQLKHTIVMETGGMKGRRKELIRSELHDTLKRSLGVKQIHSEYGMTELLSQAYSLADGRFNPGPFMKVLIRDVNDPFHVWTNGRTGGINVIDLANRNSCAFIATQDLGSVYQDGTFEVLGRFDSSDQRGCNLMVQ